MNSNSVDMQKIYIIGEKESGNSAMQLKSLDLQLIDVDIYTTCN